MRPTRTYDQEKFSVNLARLKKAGETYELVVDPDKAVLFKEGQEVDIEDVLKAQNVFVDAKKGEHAPEDRMKEVFGSADMLAIAEIILKEGEIQLTAEYRAKVREEKRNRIIQLICRNACDPKTKLPHPAQRIENAMEEAKVRVDEFKRAEDQVQDIIKSLRSILPISVEMRLIKVRIPATYAGKLYGTVQSYGTIQQEEWLNDGSWGGKVLVPAGLSSEFFDKLNSQTHGGVETEIIE